MSCLGNTREEFEFFMKTKSQFKPFSALFLHMAQNKCGSNAMQHSCEVDFLPGTGYKNMCIGYSIIIKSESSFTSTWWIQKVLKGASQMWKLSKKPSYFTQEYICSN